MLDVGCGFGDFGLFLQSRSQTVAYTGVDINGSLLSHAVKSLPDSIFVEGDFNDCNLRLGTHDVVVSLGLFGAKLSSQNQEEYIFTSVRRMLDLSDLGVIVDFMTDRVDWKDDLGFHMPPERVLELAYGLSRRFVLVHDYLPYEYSLVLVKD